MATPNGSLLKYDYLKGTITNISTNVPSDINDNSRKNDIGVSEKNKIDADRLRKMLNKLLRLSINSIVLF